MADPANETWGFFDPGRGFLLGKSKLGELSLSGYAMVRYLNQVDKDGEFTDHLGNVRTVDGRKDIYSHRVLVWLNGWVGTPKLRYTIAWWTVTATDQDALFGNIGYQFSKKFNLYAGIFGNPGSRSMQGSHPYWLGNDRVMADEFFRPFFTQGIFANGELTPGLWYSATMGNTSSILGTTAAQLDREFTYGGSLWWMPTTKEFGPRGAYGDWEMHEKLATRFGVSAVYSPEERYNGADTAPGITAPAPGNTSLKLADSVNLFETGALVDGITVTNADYRIIAIDAGMKYKGVFLQTEYYYRVLDNFKANGALPVRDINDHGFYVQAAFYPLPKKIELYAATSQVFGDSSAGFGNSSDYIIGMNYYIANSRNNRLNIQLIDVNKSPVSSTFGYYVGGQTGYTVAVAASIFLMRAPHRRHAGGAGLLLGHNTRTGIRDGTMVLRRYRYIHLRRIDFPVKRKNKDGFIVAIRPLRHGCGTAKACLHRRCEFHDIGVFPSQINYGTVIPSICQGVSSRRGSLNGTGTDRQPRHARWAFNCRGGT